MGTFTDRLSHFSVWDASKAFDSRIFCQESHKIKSRRTVVSIGRPNKVQNTYTKMSALLLMKPAK